MAKPLRGMWVGYAGVDDDEIRKAFQAKHLYPPDEVKQHGPIKLAGPLRVGDVVQVGERAQTGGEG